MFIGEILKSRSIDAMFILQIVHLNCRGSDTLLFVPVTNEKSWPPDVFLGQKGQIMGQKGQKGRNH